MLSLDFISEIFFCSDIFSDLSHRIKSFIFTDDGNSQSTWPNGPSTWLNGPDDSLLSISSWLLILYIHDYDFQPFLS